MRKNRDWTARGGGRDEADGAKAFLTHYTILRAASVAGTGNGRSGPQELPEEKIKKNNAEERRSERRPLGPRPPKKVAPTRSCGRS